PEKPPHSTAVERPGAHRARPLSPTPAPGTCTLKGVCTGGDLPLPPQPHLRPAEGVRAPARTAPAHRGPRGRPVRLAPSLLPLLAALPGSRRAGGRPRRLPGCPLLPTRPQPGGEAVLRGRGRLEPLPPPVALEGGEGQAP